MVYLFLGNMKKIIKKILDYDYSAWTRFFSVIMWVCIVIIAVSKYADGEADKGTFIVALAIYAQVCGLGFFDT